jgi:hypothetical protein
LELRSRPALLEAELARRKRDFEGERYTAFVGIQLTPTQRRAVEGRAAEAGISLSDYGRAQLTKNGGVIAVPASRDAKAIRELAAEAARIGNNLNQMALRANIAGQVQSEENLRATLDQLTDVFEKIIRL